MSQEATEKIQMLYETRLYRAMEENLIATLESLGYEITQTLPPQPLTDDMSPEDIEEQHDEMDGRLSSITYSLGLPEYLFMTSTFVSDHWTRPRPEIDIADWASEVGDIPIPPPPTF